MRTTFFISLSARPCRGGKTRADTRLFEDKFLGVLAGPGHRPGRVGDTAQVTAGTGGLQLIGQVQDN